MLDHAFEDWDDMYERESVDAAAERAEGLHDFDPLFTFSEGAAGSADPARASTTTRRWVPGASLNTLRIPREQALTRPVLNRGLRRPLAPEVTRATEGEAA